MRIPNPSVLEGSRRWAQRQKILVLHGVATAVGGSGAGPSMALESVSVRSRSSRSPTPVPRVRAGSRCSRPQAGVGERGLVQCGGPARITTPLRSDSTLRSLAVSMHGRDRPELRESDSTRFPPGHGVQLGRPWLARLSASFSRMTKYRIQIIDVGVEKLPGVLDLRPGRCRATVPVIRRCFSAPRKWLGAQGCETARRWSGTPATDGSKPCTLGRQTRGSDRAGIHARRQQP